MSQTQAAAEIAVDSDNEAAIIAFLEQKYPGIEISKFREADLIEAYVPARHIYTEDVPVDEAHVNELYEDIKDELENGRKSGQTLPVWLGQIDAFDKLPVIDGFHRTAAISKLDNPMVYAAISLGTTWEKVIDERIIAANMHKSVRFSRVIEWVNDAWSRSPWSEQIDATQAFALTLQSRRNSRLLPPDQLDLLREWVGAKCKQWKLSSASIHDFLSVASIASPELVNEARERPSGHELTVITPSHLKAIASALPNRWELQEFAASICVANNLTVPLSRSLAMKLAAAEDLAEARNMMAPGLIDSLTPEYSSRRPGETRGRKPLSAGKSSKGSLMGDPELLRNFFYDELQIAKLGVANHILRARYIASPLKTPQALTTELSPAQRDMALRKVGLQEDTIWTPKGVRVFGEAVAKISGHLKDQLISRKGHSEQEAEDILHEAKKRITADIQSGAMRFEEIGDESLIRKLYVNAVNDELRQRKAGVTVLPVEKNPPPIGLTTKNLEDVLPRYDARSRQTLVMHFVYNLSPFTTGQLLGVSEQDVYRLLPDLSLNLKHAVEGIKREINEEDL